MCMSFVTPLTKGAFSNRVGLKLKFLDFFFDTHLDIFETRLIVICSIGLKVAYLVSFRVMYGWMF